VQGPFSSLSPRLRRPVMLTPAAVIAFCALGSRGLQAGAQTRWGPDPAALGALRAAVEDLVRTFGDRYPKGREFLARLKRLAAEFPHAKRERAEALKRKLEALRREALLANPLVSGRPILFVVRKQYRSDHHNTATMFQTGEINAGSFTGGGALKTIDLGAGGAVRTLLELPEGVVRDPDVSFDGRKVLFSMRRNAQDDYHIYELEIESGRLRQLTFGSGISDIDPIYLPDGRVLFTSTRDPKYCMCNRHIMGNLFVMDGDGANIQQIGHSTLHEGHASLLSDGRVIYDRWEYVDRNFGDAQGVWVTFPDGTNNSVFWGNNTNSPGGVIDAREIPGTGLFIATFTSCHDRPWGALAIVDPARGLDGRAPVVRTWPAGAINLVGKGNYDTFKRVQPKYEDPYPLSDRYFLAARMTGRGEEMGIHLLDTFGNEILVYVEKPGCFDPMPLGPRRRPPVIPSGVDLAEKEGAFYVVNVYTGTGMERVAPGTVKYLRVVESPEKRFWTNPAWDGGTGQQAPAMAWNDFNNKRILGTVPVEEDGSAYFIVPADTFVYFQLLDERGMMIQSMRSGTIVRPGETRGCVGCHEDRRTSVPTPRYGLAWRRPPRRLKPWYGPPRLFSYTAEVQPVFDRNCTSCHDYGREAGGKLNLAGDLGLVFNTSYVELRKKGYVRVVGAGPYEVLPPFSWGSHASPLVNVLIHGHGKPEIDNEIDLSKEEFDRIVTWIDINAPYYPSYAAGAFRKNLYGRSPLSDAQLRRLSELCGVNVMDRAKPELVNFTRPALSPCLAGFRDRNDPRYREALAIIEAGREALRRHRRPDMPGFRLVDPIEIEKQRKCERLARQEARMRAAIKRGAKLYPAISP